MNTSKKYLIYKSFSNTIHKLTALTYCCQHKCGKWLKKFTWINTFPFVCSEASRYQHHDSPAIPDSRSLRFKITKGFINSYLSRNNVYMQLQHKAITGDREQNQVIPIKYCILQKGKLLLIILNTKLNGFFINDVI